MADTAAFFANKKKKKKAFKFNANKIDASTVTQTVHVDAPALSTDNDVSAAGSSALPSAAHASATDRNDAGEQWDDEALAATLTKKNAAAVASGATAELLDMKALDLKRTEQGDIAEKLRVEETKAQLAAAREGMEREAARIKEEKEKKEQEKVAGSSRFGAAAAGMAGGSKWVPPHMRGGGGGMMAGRPGWGAGASTKVDTQDENLFPDLAAADAIIEQQKNQQPAFRVPKKTPVGGGATWGSRLKKKLPEQRKVENGSNEGPAKPSSPPAEESKPAEPAKTEPDVAEASSEPPKAETAAPAKAPVKPKKKKKKDLSTFKASS